MKNPPSEPNLCRDHGQPFCAECALFPADPGMTDQQLESLAVRCEQAEGPDRVTDVEIQLAVYGDQRYGAITGNKHQVVGWGTLGGFLETCRSVINADDAIDAETVPYFTASLDAALTLVPERAWVRLDQWPRDFCAPVATVMPVVQVENNLTHTATGDTLALALCAAALRARAAQ